MDVFERLTAALADRYALVRRIGSGGWLFFSLVTRRSDIWAADLVEGR